VTGPLVDSGPCHSSRSAIIPFFVPQAL